jgi:hypothetical protein
MNAETRFELAKLEILRDIELRLVPIKVSSFEELDTFMDANCYGGFGNEVYQISEDFILENEVQNKIDNWITSDGIIASMKNLKEDFEDGAQNRFRNNDNVSFIEWLENKINSILE